MRSAIASHCRCPTRTSRRCASCVRPSDSREMRYLRERREALGGVPAAAPAAKRAALAIPPLERYAQIRARSRRQGDVDDDGRRAPDRRTAQGRDRSARASCRSSPTRRARSAWRACSARSASIRRSASSTSRRTPARCSSIAKRRTARCSRRASPRRARSRRGPPRRRRTACTVTRCCRSTSTTRCSVSSASAT